MKHYVSSDLTSVSSGYCECVVPKQLLSLRLQNCLTPILSNKNNGNTPESSYLNTDAAFIRLRAAV